MIELVSYLGMFLVLLAVWRLSAGHVLSGNWANIAATICWASVGFYADQWILMQMNIILFARSAYVLYRIGDSDAKI